MFSKYLKRTRERLKKRKAKKKYQIIEVENIISKLNERGNKFLGVLNQKSDISTILVGTNYIEIGLKNILKNNMNLVNCKESDTIYNQFGILGTVRNKNKFCRCLGLINEQLYNDIKDMIDIRNKVAHIYETEGFDDVKIINICNKLGRNIKNKKEYDKNFKNDPKGKYINMIFNIMYFLNIKILKDELTN